MMCLKKKDCVCYREYTPQEIWGISAAGEKSKSPSISSCHKSILYVLQRCEENARQCIPLNWFCNARADCPQGSDEEKCACEKYHMKQCTTAENNILCVPESWICDGYVDCEQAEGNYSKSAVASPKCSSEEYLCHMDQMCISNAIVCDGLIDCVGMADLPACKGDLQD